MLLDPRSTGVFALGAAALFAATLDQVSASAGHDRAHHRRGVKPLIPEINASVNISIAPTLYVRKEALIGRNFFKAFEFVTVDDPTEGRVKYVVLSDPPSRPSADAVGSKLRRPEDGGRQQPHRGHRQDSPASSRRQEDCPQRHSRQGLDPHHE